jgi:hypothetical protein
MSSEFLYFILTRTKLTVRDRTQTSLKNTQGRPNQRSGQHTLARQKNRKAPAVIPLINEELIFCRCEETARARSLFQAVKTYIGDSKVSQYNKEASDPKIKVLGKYRNI